MPRSELSDRVRFRLCAVTVAIALVAYGRAAWSAPGAPTPPGEFPFVHVGSDLGLGEVGAWQMAQDSVGYLWIAAESGVYRYDGRHVIHFAEAEGLPAAYSTQIAVGKDDVVWSVTSSGLARYRDAQWRAMGEERPGLGLESARRIAVDSRGRLWVTTSAGVVRESAAGELALDASWPSDPHGLFIDAEGAVLVGAVGEVHVQEANGARRVIDAGLPREPITSLVRDGRGRMWAVAATGVFVAPPEARGFAPWPGLTLSEVLVSLDGSARPWFASDAGVFYADDAGARRRVTGLTNDFLGGTFVDREGSMWALGFGIFRIAGRGLWRVYLEKEGLPKNTIWAIRRSADDLWVGTAAGLARATADGFARATRVPEEPIRSIVPDARGALWLSGPAGRVFHYDPAGDALLTFDATRGVPAGRTNALAMDARGAVWIGTVDHGLVRSVGATPSEMRFEPVPLEGGEGAGTVRDLLVDRRGVLWVTSDRGLFAFDGDRRRRYTSADGLKSNAVAYLLERRSGELCVSYWVTGGLGCFRVSGERLEPTASFDAAHGLASNVVYLLGEDSHARLWIGTNAGVDMVDGEHVAHFGTLDGLPSFDCDARAFAADDDGDVWIGTSRGLGRFLGAQYSGPPAPPRSALIATHKSRDGGTRSVRDGDRLDWDERAVEVEFAALSFLHESAMEYQTRLLGAGDGWQAALGDRTRYDALSPDRYELQVRARHPGGAWGAPAVVRFSVAAPWWQSTWFRIAIAAAAAGAIFGLVRWRSASLARQNRELEETVAARTRDLAKAHSAMARSEKLSALGRMLAQLSHELNNPMNVVANNVAPLKEYVTELKSILALYRAESRALPDGGAALEARWQEVDIDFVVKDSTEALEVIEQASQRVCAIQADLAAFLRGDAAAKVEGDLNADLRATVRMVTHRLPPHVTIATDYGALPKVEYDAGRINQVFLNLLQNAVHAVDGRGTITVRTRSVAGGVQVEIADDGPGIPPEIRERIFEPFFTTKPIGKGTGLGLSICRQIVVEQHGGTIQLSDDARGGAAFVLTLPLPAPTDEAAPIPT